MPSLTRVDLSWHESSPGEPGGTSRVGVSVRREARLTDALHVASVHGLFWSRSLSASRARLLAAQAALRVAVTSVFSASRGTCREQWLWRSSGMQGQLVLAAHMPKIGPPVPGIRPCRRSKGE